MRKNKSSQILRDAAYLIDCGMTSHVCFAVRMASKDQKIAYRICKKIQESLDGYSTVALWLRNNSSKFRYFEAICTDKEYWSEIRRYRASWCLWMAKGYESKGD